MNLEQKRKPAPSVYLYLSLSLALSLGIYIYTVQDTYMYKQVRIPTAVNASMVTFPRFQFPDSFSTMSPPSLLVQRHKRERQRKRSKKGKHKRAKHIREKQTQQKQV